MTPAPDGQVIDLDTARPDDPPPGALPRVRVRRSGAAIAAALTLVLISGSTAPERLLQRLLTAPLDASRTFVLGADALVLPDPRSSGTVTAYDLADGARRWSARLTDPVGSLAVDDEDGVVLAETAARTTTALDLRTGAVLWTLPGFPYPRFPGSVVVTYYDRPGQPARARLVGSRTGEGTWQTLIEDDTSVFATGAPARLVIVRATGDTAVYDPADGRTVATGTLPVTGGDRVDRTVTVHGALLLLREPRTDSTVLRAYTTDTLQPLWTSAVPASAEFARDCGPYVCLRVPDGFVAVDPVDGRTRWTAPGRVLSDDVGPRLVTYDPRESTGWTLLDALTGRPVAALGPGAWPGSGLFLRGEAGSSRTFVARVDPAAGHRRIIGSLPRATADTCRARADRLACPTTGNDLELWGE